MGQSKLQLSQEVRTFEREEFNQRKKKAKLIPVLYLKCGQSNIGRNKAKREQLVKSLQSTQG